MITFTELLERAKSEKIAIHTPTEEQAQLLLSELDKRGYLWRGGNKLTDATYYENENTCYDFGMSNYSDKVTYESLDWYQENNYTIVDFSDIDFKEE